MSLRVTVQQAAANALAAFLASKLPDVEVAPRWPDANKKLPAKAISIVLAGARQDTIHAPIAGESVQVAGNIYATRWKLGEASQPMQLDVWAQYDADRDDVLARLEDVLTIGDESIGRSGDPFSPLLLLALGDGWDAHYADFAFDGPDVDDTPDSVNQSEYRATMRGQAFIPLSRVHQDPKLALVRMRLALTQGATRTEFAITPTNVTVSQVP